MRLLVVAATEGELGPIIGAAPRRHRVDVLITGVGMVATAARCARALASGSYQAAFNFGVCGAFDPRLALGTVVHVTSERISELGVEDGDAFLTMPEVGLTADVVVDNTAPPHNATLQSLPTVQGITVNTVHGNERSIAEVLARCQPQVESMEGAAFAYACAMSGVPYAQVRAVSNRVERRNRRAWRLDLAMENLQAVALRVLGDE